MTDTPDFEFALFIEKELNGQKNYFTLTAARDETGQLDLQLRELTRATGEEYGNGYAGGRQFSVDVTHVPYYDLPPAVGRRMGAEERAHEVRPFGTYLLHIDL
jgi:hypothetical protein